MLAGGRGGRGEPGSTAAGTTWTSVAPSRRASAAASSSITQVSSTSGQIQNGCTAGSVTTATVRAVAPRRRSRASPPVVTGVGADREVGAVAAQHRAQRAGGRRGTEAPEERGEAREPAQDVVGEAVEAGGAAHDDAVGEGEQPGPSGTARDGLDLDDLGTGPRPAHPGGERPGAGDVALADRGGEQQHPRGGPW